MKFRFNLNACTKQGRFQLCLLEFNEIMKKLQCPNEKYGFCVQLHTVVMVAQVVAMVLLCTVCDSTFHYIVFKLSWQPSS